VKTALITGVVGQDGAYLAELLLGIETDDMILNIAAWNAGDALESVSAKLGRVV
jgi:GDP-D-mannose dehydratase